MGGVAVNFLVGLYYYVDLVLLKTVGRLGNRRAFTAQCVRARGPACGLQTQSANPLCKYRYFLLLYYLLHIGL